MVKLGKIAEKVMQPKARPKGQVLDEKFIENRLEFYGFKRKVAGDTDFDHAVEALCVAAGSNRGILATGPNGCGKTQFLKAVWRMIIAPKQWISCADENQVGWLSWYYELYHKNVFLDDFGAERFVYGDVDRVGDFICRWYEWHDPSRLLLVSTNLTGAQIDDDHGGRVFDRLRDKCVILKFEGGSKRKEIIV